MASGANAAPRPHRRDKPCWRCGYSLRKLPLESRNCPECGLAVRISLSGDLSLHIADPIWLGRLCTGALACAAAVCMHFSVLLLTGVVSFSSDTLTIMTAALIFLTTVLLLAGWWLLAQPARYGLLETPNNVVSVLRGVASAIVLLCAMLVILPAIQKSVSLGMIVSGFVSFVATQVVHLMCLFRLQTLLSRHSNSRRVRKWALVSSWIAIIALTLPCWAGASWEILITLLEQDHSLVVARIVLALILLQYAALWLIAANMFRRAAADAESAWVSD